jgi:hypothetical protein
MGKLDDLAARYERQLRLRRESRTGLRGLHRVLMVVYDPELERTLRARKEEFAQRTRAAGWSWLEFDCTPRFARWMASMDYAESYFEAPDDLAMALENDFPKTLVAELGDTLDRADENTLIGVTGAGSLYGVAFVHNLVHEVERRIKGQLAVFFPGHMDGTTFRLLDARDGWNYQAVGISPTSGDGV